MPAKIHIERMMHRSSIAVLGESAASYALIKLIPAGDGGGRALGLNLALVLDVSGSMYEEDGTGISRLKRIQDAAISAISKLKPDDTLAIVAFAYNAQVLLPPTKIAEREKIEDVIRKVDMFDVDPGGTAMDQGMDLALAEVEKAASPGKLSQVLVLTDGETSGEATCRELAKKAAQKKIHLSMMGVGTDWNSSLIKDLAKLSEGKWYYIDVNQKESAEQIFAEEFESLASAAFLDVEMHIRPTKDVKVKRVRMVVPEIKELKTSEPEERHLVAQLGTLERDKTSKYIIDLSLPKRPDGKFMIANLEVSWNPGTGKRESTSAPLEMVYTSAGHGYINAEVARHIDEVQIAELNQNLQQAIAANNTEQAKAVAEQIVKKGELMGPRAAKKTMLAKSVVEELNAGGRVSKKTQLAMDDAAREAAEMPVPG
ncbi:MAG: VWA domain-containing protein [Gemmataceae bacterium]|nr:VWA domain-containing protein [Gemmataceae bacterium]MDW8266648.1 VWA domain-containing protein [Gemmataceae bacterium]